MTIIKGALDIIESWKKRFSSEIFKQGILEGCHLLTFAYLLGRSGWFIFMFDVRIWELFFLIRNQLK
jgi:hypothetical protein